MMHPLAYALLGVAGLLGTYVTVLSVMQLGPFRPTMPLAIGVACAACGWALLQ